MHPSPFLGIKLIGMVDFSYHVKNGDRISVYPEFETMDISPLVRLRPQPLRDLKLCGVPVVHES